MNTLDADAISVLYKHVACPFALKLTCRGDARWVSPGHVGAVLAVLGPGERRVGGPGTGGGVFKKTRSL